MHQAAEWLAWNATLLSYLNDYYWSEGIEPSLIDNIGLIQGMADTMGAVQ